MNSMPGDFLVFRSFIASFISINFPHFHDLFTSSLIGWKTVIRWSANKLAFSLLFFAHGHECFFLMGGIADIGFLEFLIGLQIELSKKSSKFGVLFGSLDQYVRVFALCSF